MRRVLLLLVACGALFAGSALGAAPPRAAISHIKIEPGGTVTFSVKVPGPGRIDVLETAWDNNFARIARLLQPAAHRFVFARAQATIQAASIIQMRVKPTARGALLVRDHTYLVTLRLWVTYTPVGGHSLTVGLYGVELGAGAPGASN